MINKAELKEKYEFVKNKLINENIRSINNYKEKVIVISNRYNGIWLEHVYDSIIYARLFNDYSIAINTINLFIDLQNELGQLPCFIKSDSSIGYSQLQECVSFYNLCFVVYEKIRDINFLKKVYTSLNKWIGFVYKYRMTLDMGLVEMFVGYDTGHDNSPRLDTLKYKGYYSINGKRINANIKPDDTPIIALDLNCNLYMNLNIGVKIAKILNDSNNEIKFLNLSKELKRNMFKYLLDKNKSFFFDLKDNKKIEIYSISILHLFQERVLDLKEDKELIDNIFNKYINNKKEFNTNYPFPSISISDKSSINHRMTNSWGYYSQALTTLRLSLWMDYYGYSNELDNVLLKWVEVFIKYYNEFPFTQEIDPISGIPTDSSPYYSTSMLLFLYGINRLKLI